MTAVGVVCHSRTHKKQLDSQDLYRSWRNSACWFLQRKLGESRATSSSVNLMYSIRLAPVDSILTRMGAYDNMFSNASTFKVELDEWYASPQSVTSCLKIFMKL